MTEKNTLLDALKNVVDVAFEDVHTALPGRFESFDFKTRKASVKPLLKKTYLDDTILDLPVISGVPVVFPSTTSSGVFFPINKGDKCLLVFSERDLERWALSGNDSEPADPRRFDLSDAIAIPGLFSFKEKSPASNNTDLEIYHKGFKIVIKPNGKIQIIGKGNNDLVSILDEFMEQVKNSTVITGIGLQPFDPASILALTAIQNKIKELLV